MSTDTIAGRVKQVKAQNKQDQARHNDNLVGMMEGKRDELVGMAQEKYGQAKAMTEQFADDVAYRADLAKKTVDSRLSEYNGKMETAADRLPGDLNATITRYPWMTVVVIFMLGFLIGTWLKPSSR